MIGRVLWNGLIFGLGAGAAHKYMTGSEGDAGALFTVFVLCVVTDCADKARGF